METLRKIFGILFLFLGWALSCFAQPQASHWGFVQLQNQQTITGTLLFDFEQELLTVITTDTTTKEEQTQQFAFAVLQQIACYDETKKIHRQFVYLQHNLYEVILSGELSLLRKYTANLRHSNQESGVNYFVYLTSQDYLLPTNKIKKKFEQVFTDNSPFVRHLAKIKQYNLDDMKHLASLIRYHNQCCAKNLAKN